MPGRSQDDSSSPWQALDSDSTFIPPDNFGSTLVKDKGVIPLEVSAINHTDVSTLDLEDLLDGPLDTSNPISRSPGARIFVRERDSSSYHPHVDSHRRDYRQAYEDEVWKTWNHYPHPQGLDETSYMQQVDHPMRVQKIFSDPFSDRNPKYLHPRTSRHHYSLAQQQIEARKQAHQNTLLWNLQNLQNAEFSYRKRLAMDEYNEKWVATAYYLNAGVQFDLIRLRTVEIAKLKVMEINERMAYLQRLFLAEEEDARQEVRMQQQVERENNLSAYDTHYKLAIIREGKNTLERELSVKALLQEEHLNYQRLADIQSAEWSDLILNISTHEAEYEGRQRIRDQEGMDRQDMQQQLMAQRSQMQESCIRRIEVCCDDENGRRGEILNQEVETWCILNQLVTSQAAIFQLEIQKRLDMYNSSIADITSKESDSRQGIQISESVARTFAEDQSKVMLQEIIARIRIADQNFEVRETLVQVKGCEKMVVYDVLKNDLDCKLDLLVAQEKQNRENLAESEAQSWIMSYQEIQLLLMEAYGRESIQSDEKDRVLTMLDSIGTSVQRVHNQEYTLCRRSMEQAEQEARQDIIADEEDVFRMCGYAQSAEKRTVMVVGQHHELMKAQKEGLVQDALEGCQYICDKEMCVRSDAMQRFKLCAMENTQRIQEIKHREMYAWYELEYHVKMEQDRLRYLRGLTVRAAAVWRNFTLKRRAMRHAREQQMRRCFRGWKLFTQEGKTEQKAAVLAIEGFWQQKLDQDKKKNAEARALVDQQQAATKIQCAQRRKMAERETRLRERKTKAVPKIQAWFRFWSKLARVRQLQHEKAMAQEMEKAASDVQRVWRGSCGRTLASNKREDLREKQAAKELERISELEAQRAKLAALENQAAGDIQRIWRGRCDRNAVKSKRSVMLNEAILNMLIGIQEQHMQERQMLEDAYEMWRWNQALRQVELQQEVARKKLSDERTLWLMQCVSEMITKQNQVLNNAYDKWVWNQAADAIILNETCARQIIQKDMLSDHLRLFGAESKLVRIELQEEEARKALSEEHALCWRQCTSEMIVGQEHLSRMTFEASAWRKHFETKSDRDSRALKLLQAEVTHQTELLENETKELNDLVQEKAEESIVEDPDLELRVQIIKDELDQLRALRNQRHLEELGLIQQEAGRKRAEIERKHWKRTQQEEIRNAELALSQASLTRLSSEVKEDAKSRVAQRLLLATKNAQFNKTEEGRDAERQMRELQDMAREKAELERAQSRFEMQSKLQEKMDLLEKQRRRNLRTMTNAIERAKAEFNEREQERENRRAGSIQTTQDLIYIQPRTQPKSRDLDATKLADEISRIADHSPNRTPIDDTNQMDSTHLVQNTKNAAQGAVAASKRRRGPSKHHHSRMRGSRPTTPLTPPLPSMESTFSLLANENSAPNPDDKVPMPGPMVDDPDHDHTTQKAVEPAIDAHLQNQLLTELEQAVELLKGEKEERLRRVSEEDAHLESMIRSSGPGTRVTSAKSSYKSPYTAKGPVSRATPRSRPLSGKGSLTALARPQSAAAARPNTTSSHQTLSTMLEYTPGPSRPITPSFARPATAGPTAGRMGVGKLRPSTAGIKRSRPRTANEGPVRRKHGSPRGAANGAQDAEFLAALFLASDPGTRYSKPRQDLDGSTLLSKEALNAVKGGDVLSVWDDGISMQPHPHQEPLTPEFKGKRQTLIQ